jgi:hypothetical protein
MHGRFIRCWDKSLIWTDSRILRPRLAIGAVATDFGASDGNLDLAVVFNLTLHLLEEAAFHFPYFPAAQAGDMDMIARAVAFVKMLLTVDVKKVELVNQAHFFKHVEGAIDGDAVNLRVDALRPLEDCAGIEMALGAVHHLKQDAALAREAHSALGESGLQSAGRVVSVDTLTTGNSLCVGRSHVKYRGTKSSR